MPTTTLTFLGRKRIAKEHVRVRVDAVRGVSRFTVDANLEHYGFPADAQVFIDAKQLMETRRYSLGTISAPAPTVAHELTGFSGNRFVFSLTVIDPTDARRLGSADAIQATESTGSLETSDPLLPVDASQDLDGLLWAVRFVEPDKTGAQDAPVLLIDRHAAGESVVLFLSEPGLRAAIVPAAAIIALTAAVDTSDGEFDPAGIDWRNAWLRFGTRLAGRNPPTREERHDPNVVQEWAAEAVRQIANRERMVASVIQARRAGR